jgi:hypothetical protein
MNSSIRLFVEVQQSEHGTMGAEFACASRFVHARNCGLRGCAVWAKYIRVKYITVVGYDIFST